MQPAPSVHVEVAGTHGAAVHAPRRGSRAAAAVHMPALCTAERTPTAILTLTAQTHDSFGMSELTRGTLSYIPLLRPILENGTIRTAIKNCSRTQSVWLLTSDLLT